MADERGSLEARRARAQATFSDPVYLARAEERVKRTSPCLVEGMWAPDFPPEERDKILRDVATACANYHLEIMGSEVEDIDGIIERWTKIAPPGVRHLQRIGDTLLYLEQNQAEYNPDENGIGRCSCILQRRGLVPPSPEYCKCTVNYEEIFWGRVFKHPVVAEIIESPLTTGSSKCAIAIHLKPPVYSSAKIKR